MGLGAREDRALEGLAGVDGLEGDAYDLLGLDAREDRELEVVAREDALDEEDDAQPPGVFGMAYISCCSRRGRDPLDLAIVSLGGEA